MDLKGQVGIITGGGRGIGAATARRLAALGARVVIASTSPDQGAQVVADISAAGGEALFVAANVRRFEDLEHLHNVCLDRFGRIDFAIANAGLADTSSMSEGDPQHWRDVIETNVLGTAYMVRVVLPAMQAQRKGHIVLIASVAGLETHAGEPIYLASKWAVVGLGRALRKEVLGSGVRVTLIEPGLTDTPLTRSVPGIEKWMTKVNPLQTEDVAQAIAYALLQPEYMSINEIVMRPLRQEA